MLSAAAFVLASVLAWIPGAQAGDYHLRPLDARIAGWLAVGASSSPTFRSLLDQLRATDVIVYLAIADRLPAGINGQLSFVTSTKTARYLRVDVVAHGTTTDMVAILGHELQHAVEIAGAGHIRDSQDMATFYLYMGEAQSNGTRNESLAARDVGERVMREVTASGRRTSGSGSG